MSNYILGLKKERKGFDMAQGLKSFAGFLDGEKSKIIIVCVAVLLNSISTIITPYLISLAIDQYISKFDLNGLFKIIWSLLAIYIVTVFAGYFQSNMMGRLSQRTLFRLRNALFSKIQFLPVAFFNQNKAGDLISRLNNDTDKLNQFLSESVIRFVSIFFGLTGIGVFIFFINYKMALMTVFSCVFLYIITNLLSPWLEKLNKKSLAATGHLSSEVQESLTNFKVVIAFNRQGYFRERFKEVNQENFKRTFLTEFAGGLFNPIYNFAGNISQLAVLVFGLFLISQGQLSIGILIGFITYTQKFYEPLRILGSIWASMQSALAAWSRIQEIMGLESNLKIETAKTQS
ncbi:MAG: ABC transporter ATP-binding protein [bacterium]